MANYWDEIAQSMRDSRDYAAQLRGEFQKLLGDPCLKPVSVGDIVVVAAGLLGKGHPWIRIECAVVAVADTSVRVRFTGDYIRQSDEMWVHPALITDVIGPHETRGNQASPAADPGTSPEPLT